MPLEKPLVMRVELDDAPLRQGVQQGEDLPGGSGAIWKPPASR